MSIQSWSQPVRDLNWVQNDSAGWSKPGNFPRLLNSVGNNVLTLHFRKVRAVKECGNK